MGQRFTTGPRITPTAKRAQAVSTPPEPTSPGLFQPYRTAGVYTIMAHDDFLTLAPWRIAVAIDEEHKIKDCEGCGHSIWADDKYCPGCGADLNDLYARILNTNYDDIEAFIDDEAWTRKPRKQMAADVRKWIKHMGFNGVCARSAKGYSWQVEIGMPDPHDDFHHDDLGRGQSTQSMHLPPRCAGCERQHAATTHLCGLLYAAFTASHNKTDIQSDYFNETFYMWGHA